jgi:hypothetical protein
MRNLRRIVIAIDHDDRIAFFRSFPVPYEELLSARRSYATSTTVFWKGAAKVLGLKPSTSEYRMKKLGIARNGLRVAQVKPLG